MPAPLESVFDPRQRHSPNITPFVRYTDMLRRFGEALASGDTSTSAWRQMIRGFRGLPPIAQITQVNEAMNKRPYVPEIRDYWMSPGEFLKYGGGCEDFAIAKYLALRDLGHAEGNLRIVIVNDLLLRIPHALLTVHRGEGGTLVLDNQDKAVRRAADVHRYAPLYSINRLGWWHHGKPLST